MSIAPRIDELRKKFEENPRRYFAPLANELRKAGDLAQAIALCREHLPKQPGHMSGHIVFGQALYENGDLNEGRAVFEQALALDPENLIALRHLGDIARQLGDAPAARRWYERVLEADPRNDDIAAQLATLGVGHTPAAVAAVVPAASTPPMSTAHAEPMAEVAAEPTALLDLEAAPLELPSLSALQASTEVPAPANEAPVFFDLDAIEAAAHEVEAIEAAAGEAATDPFFDGAADAPSDQIVAAAEAEAELSFEEGLVAAAWPDTSDLAARAATPRSITPAYVAVPAEAVDAFGREPQDDVVAGLPESELDLVEASAAAQPVAGVESMESSEESFDAPGAVVASIGDLTGGIQVASSILAFEEDTSAGLVQELVELGSVAGAADEIAIDIAIDETAEIPVAELPPHAEPIDLGAFEVPVLTPIDTVAVVEPGAVEEMTVAEVALEAVDTPEHVSTDVAGELAWIAAPDAEPDEDDEDEPAHNEAVGVLAEADDDEPVAVFDDAESEPLGVAEADTDDAELPWLAAPVTPDAEVGAIVEAFAEDARAKGEADDVSVIAMPEPTAAEPISAAVESSFAHVMDGSEQEESEPAVAVSAAGSAFVTETMGELLVAQGFTERAISVYEELVRRRPDDPAPAARLAELREQSAGPAASPVAHLTPVQSSVITLAEKQTARARFAALAARRVERRTPVYATLAITPPMGQPAEVAPDLHAGRSADSLATLFGSDPAPQDDEAAQAFASAFSGTGSESDSDSFFGSGSMTAVREPTPAMGSARFPTPLGSARVAVSTPPAEAGGGSYSFDRFFPDPATARPSSGSVTPVSPLAEPTTPTESAATEGKAADDLAQFSAWLKGLGNP